MNDDERHLDLLAIFHYVVAAIVALFGLFPIFHLVIGIAALSGAIKDERGEPLPVWFGIIFIGVALMLIAMAWTLAVLVVLAGRNLKRRRAYTYCLVVAAVECMFMPFGTVLGVLTIVVLMRPSVKALFGVPFSTTASS